MSNASLLTSYAPTYCRRETDEPVAHPRHRALRAVHDFAQRERVTELVDRQRPLLGERVDVADDEQLRRGARERQRQVVLAERVMREQSDHRAGPTAEQQRNERLHHHREQCVGRGLRRMLRRTFDAAERVGQRNENGFEAVERFARPAAHDRRSASERSATRRCPSRRRPRAARRVRRRRTR